MRRPKPTSTRAAWGLGLEASGLLIAMGLCLHPLPAAAQTSFAVCVAGAPSSVPTRALVEGMAIGPDRFSTLGVPILAGRVFREDDTKPDSRVVIINEAFAARFYPGLDPVGLTLGIGRGECRVDELTVVGVAGNATDRRRANLPMIYVPARARQ